MELLPLNPLQCSVTTPQPLETINCYGDEAECTDMINNGFNYWQNLYPDSFFIDPLTMVSSCETFNWYFNLFGTFALAMVPVFAAMRVASRS